MKAAELAHKMGITDFNATSGWFDWFQERSGIHFRWSVCAPCNDKAKAMKDWDVKLKSMLQNYSPDDIYNTNKTGLFFRMLKAHPKLKTLTNAAKYHKQD
ncbi:TIGD6-like protein [Mya arenaria]|uniref:TIGD6-like protein n=1 Tax=Mya arenaria TaxID=6604 RepID=A0ABY7EZX4_MYAAR|nr:TIGD6-like protein [Mya arenaria]